jgi:hypothetical protein
MLCMRGADYPFARHGFAPVKATTNALLNVSMFIGCQAKADWFTSVKRR